MADIFSCDCEMIHTDIVNQVRTALSSTEEYFQLAELFKMFSDGTRLRILHALLNHEMCVCDLCALLGMTKSAVSHQLKNLRLMKLVRFRKDGKNVYYSLADDHVSEIIRVGFEHIHED